MKGAKEKEPLQNCVWVEERKMETNKCLTLQRKEKFLTLFSMLPIIGFMDLVFWSIECIFPSFSLVSSQIPNLFP